MPDGRENCRILANEIQERRALMADAGHVMVPLYPHEVDQVIAALHLHAEGNASTVIAGLTKCGFDVFDKPKRKSNVRRLKRSETFHPGRRM